MLKQIIAVASLVGAHAAAVAGPTSLEPAQLFATADGNGDGEVSKQEFLAERAQRFDALDANRDGALSVEEFSAAAPGARGRFLAPLMFGQFDRNGDGRVTREEFARAPTPGFDRADADGDGRISQAELKAAAP